MKNKFTKENILTFSLILFLSFLCCFNFLKPHFTIDTYILLQDGFFVYSKYALLPIGRILSTLMFYFFHYLNIDILTGIKLSSCLGIIFCSITTFLIYKSSLKYFKNSLKIKLLIFIISFLSIFNFSTIELFAYAESASMCFGLLCAVLASIVFTSQTIKHKYFYSQVLIFISTLCYQSTLSVFVILTLFHLFIMEINISKNIKKIIICFAQYGLATIFNLALIELVLIFSDIDLYKISFKFSIHNILTNFIYFSKALLIDGLHSIPKFSYIITLIITFLILVFIIKKKNLSIKYLINAFVFVITSYVFTLLPMLSMDVTDLYYSPRMYIGTILILPFLIIYICFIIKSSSTYIHLTHKKIINIIIILFINIMFICNFIFYHFSSRDMLLSNENDKKIATYILNKIDNYEQTNEKILYIAVLYDTFPSFTYSNTNLSCVSRGFASNWSITDILSYYGKREFLPAENISEATYNKYFLNKNWNYFSDEQLVFVKDTLYICVY